MNEGVVKHQGSTHRKWLVPAVLVVCVLMVGFWEIMANITRNPFRQFNLKAEHFKGFSPAINGLTFQPVPIDSSPSEPNILAFKAIPTSSQHPYSHAPAQYNSPVLIRLVHGYNMPDCMRIKGYKVELIEWLGAKRKVERVVEAERQRSGEAKIEPQIKTDKHGWENEKDGIRISDTGTKNPELGTLNTNLCFQVWRLTSGSGDVSIWITSMIRAGDFSPTDIDVRSMPFPRVGVPDDPGWFPRGFSWSSLKHPVKELRLFMRAKWNASRCDVATFLRLRTPAWASDECLTLVSASTGHSVKPHEEDIFIMQLASVQSFMLVSLQDRAKSDRIRQ